MSHVNPRIPPDWAADLVIYEVNPKAFTSPDGAGTGSGSGTFASMGDKLPYLADLGVNGVWMAGHHVATDHFYGIWSVYAALQPDRLDPTLGTPDDLKTMVAEAHDHGIRIFLDVIAHGVVHESPLLAANPAWFRSSSWGMADYDYTNPEFRKWWIGVWVDYALTYDVDGFRIDVEMCDITVWDEIVTRLTDAGKEVVVFPENECYHFSQQDVEGTPRNPVRSLLTADFLGLERRLTARQLSCHDYGWAGLPGNHFYLRGSRARAAHGALLGTSIPLFMAGEEFDADPVPLPGLTQGLYGSGGPGGWLYGNRIDWDQLAEPRKTAMRDDVKAMLGLRRRFAHLLNGTTADKRITAIPHDGATNLVPYGVGRDGTEAVIVLANDTDQEVITTIRVPRGELAFAPKTVLKISDALTGQEYVLADDDTTSVSIGPDHVGGGGFRLLHVVAR